jgi:hypothetical protein
MVRVDMHEWLQSHYSEIGCRLDLDDKLPHYSTFSENGLYRFRGNVFRKIFERVVAACMAVDLIKEAQTLEQPAS